MRPLAHLKPPRQEGGRSAPPTLAGVSPSEMAASRWTLWLLAGAVVVAAALRVRDAMATRLWFDEIFTLWIARAGIPGVLRLLSTDVHPPLYFVTVAIWRAIGGESDLWLRSLSILCGVATIAVVFQLAREMFGGRAAILSAALLALHPDHIRSSQELRSFAMLWMFLTLATLGAWRWMEQPRRRNAVLLVGAATLALYTHYLAGIGVGLIFIWGLAHDRSRALAWLGLFAMIAALFLPQAPVFIAQTRLNHAQHWVGVPAIENLIDLARHLAFGALYLVPPCLALALVPLARPAQRRPALLLWTLTLMPIVIAFALTRSGEHLFTARYMFFVLPFWCALVAAGIGGIGSRWLRLGGALLLIGLEARSALLKPPHEESASLERAAGWLAPRVRPGDVVFHADTHSLFYFRQHWPQLGTHLLLVTGDTVAYYDGGVLIPATWRVRPDDFARTRASGARWWAVRTHQSGMDTGPAEAAFDSTARAQAEFDMVRVWASEREGR